MRTLLLSSVLAFVLFPVLAHAEEHAEHADEHAQHVEAKPSPKNIVLADLGLHVIGLGFQLSLIHISEPTRPY